MATKLSLFTSKWLRGSIPRSAKDIIGRGLLSTYYGFLTIGTMYVAEIKLFEPWNTDPCDVGDPKFAYVLLPFGFGFGTIGTLMGIRAFYYLPTLQLFAITMYDQPKLFGVVLLYPLILIREHPFWKDDKVDGGEGIEIK